MKPLAIFVTLLAAVIAALQWHQIAYRLQLFYSDYGGERFANHIGDDTFILIHSVNAVLLIAASTIVWRSWRSSRALSCILCGFVAANVVAWASFAYMHRTGVLIEYHEFIRHMKRPNTSLERTGYRRCIGAHVMPVHVLFPGDDRLPSGRSALIRSIVVASAHEEGSGGVDCVGFEERQGWIGSWSCAGFAG